MKSIVFRFDCSPTIGMGHFFRTCSLAHNFYSLPAKVYFIVSPQSLQYIPPFYCSSSIVILTCLDQVPSCDVVIVDHYQDLKFIDHPLFTNAVKLLIHDTINYLPDGFNFLINASITTTHSDPRCFFGQDFIQLSPSYHTNCNSWVFSADSVDIILSFGATDSLDFICPVVELLNNLPSARSFNFVIPLLSSANSLPKIRETIYHSPLSIELMLDQLDLVEAYKLSRACIGASSSASWERACIGLPSAQFPIIDNQLEVHKTQDSLRMVFSLSTCIPSPPLHHLGHRLDEFLQRCNDPSFLFSLSHICSHAVDGLGCQRIIDITST